MSIGNEIRRLRKSRGLTLEQVKEATGFSQPFLSSVEIEKKKVSVELAQALAPVLGVSAGYLLGIENADTKEPQILSPAPFGSPRVPISGYVQAGSFADPDDGCEYPASDIMPASDYALDKQFVLIARGDSLNKIIPDGAFLRCICIESWGQPRNNELVVVERIRGQTKETTVKRYIKQGNKVILRPESTNEQHKDMDLNPRAGEEDEIKMIAVCDYFMGSLA